MKKLKYIKTHHEILQYLEGRYKDYLERYETYKKYLDTNPDKRIEALPPNLQQKVLQRRDGCLTYPRAEEEILILAEYAVKLTHVFANNKEVRTFQKHYRHTKDLSLFKENGIDLEIYKKDYDIDEVQIVHIVCSYIVSCLDYQESLDKQYFLEYLKQIYSDYTDKQIKRFSTLNKTEISIYKALSQYHPQNFLGWMNYENLQKILCTEKDLTKRLQHMVDLGLVETMTDHGFLFYRVNRV